MSTNNPILKSIDVNWDVIRKAHLLVTEDLRCRRLGWLNCLVLTPVEKDGKVYGYNLLEISHHISSPIDYQKYYLFVDIGVKVNDTEIPSDVNLFFYPKNRKVELEPTSSSLPTDILRPFDLEWKSDIFNLNEFPRTKIEPFVRDYTSSFGDNYLFSAEFEGKTYTLLCDLCRVLVFDRPAATTELTYLPLISRFIYQWDYEVIVGNHSYFIKVSDGIYIVSSRNPQNPLPKVLPLWEKSPDVYVEVTLPVTFYRRYVEKMMKTLKGGTLEIISENGQLTFNFYTSASVQAYPWWGDAKIQIPEVTPRAGAQIPYAESIHWCDILKVKEKWYNFLFPSNQKLKLAIPYGWKAMAEGEFKVLPVKVWVDGQRYPYLALYPTGLFYTADEDTSTTPSEQTG